MAPCGGAKASRCADPSFSRLHRPADFPNGAPLSAGWRRGYAADCKSVKTGSIPVPASKNPRKYIRYWYFCLEFPVPVGRRLDRQSPRPFGGGVFGAVEQFLQRRATGEVGQGGAFATDGGDETLIDRWDGRAVDRGPNRLLQIGF